MYPQTPQTHPLCRCIEVGDHCRREFTSSISTYLIDFPKCKLQAESEPFCCQKTNNIPSFHVVTRNHLWKASLMVIYAIYLSSQILVPSVPISSLKKGSNSKCHSMSFTKRPQSKICYPTHTMPTPMDTFTTLAHKAPLSRESAHPLPEHSGISSFEVQQQHSQEL